MARPPIPTPPPQPSRQQPDTFSARADAAIDYLFTDLPEYTEATLDYVDGIAQDVTAAALAGMLGDLDLELIAGYVIGVNLAGDGLDAVEIIEYPPLSVETWEAGTSDTEAPISPEKLRAAAIAALPTLATADWEAGTSTTEGVVSPAKVHAAIGSYPKLLATVNANSGSEIVITDLPDAPLRFQFVNVTCDTTSRLPNFKTSNDNGSSFPGTTTNLCDQGDFRDGVGGAIGFVELLGQARTMQSHVSNAEFNLTRTRLWRQDAGVVLSGHINAVRFAWTGGAANFTTSSAGNPDSGKILVWRLA